MPRLSAYDKAEEAAEVGRYSVRLLPEGIRVEVTATQRCGVYRFSFPRGVTANVLIDAGSAVRCYVDHRRPVLPHSVGGFVEVVSDNEVIGRGDLQGGWGHDFPYSVHFCARFDRPFSRVHTASGDFMLDSRFRVGPDAKAILSFDRAEELNLVVAISYHSLANARESLARETEGKSFDQISQETVAVWEDFSGSSAFREEPTRNGRSSTPRFTACSACPATWG